MDVPALLVDDVTHRYGDRVALDRISFRVAPGEIFGLLGPNGGGKTTLFRLIATLLPLESGRLEIFGSGVERAPGLVRQQIGVTFQSPSLDGKLTVQENLTHQGELYGLWGRPLRARIDHVLTQLGIADRRQSVVEELSGGLKRRVEIGKSLLHQPRLLLLDEPSTGLDPGARFDLWAWLTQLPGQGVTVLVTTHLMEEAEQAHRLGILHQGRLVAQGTPAELKSHVGGDRLTIQTRHPAAFQPRLEALLGHPVRAIGETVRVEQQVTPALVSRLLEAFPDDIQSIALAKPTLEDVFIQQTGHRLWESA